MISVTDIELFRLIFRLLSIKTYDNNRASFGGACTCATKFAIIVLSCVLACALTFEMMAKVVNAHAILPHA